MVQEAVTTANYVDFDLLHYGDLIAATETVWDAVARLQDGAHVDALARSLIAAAGIREASGKVQTTGTVEVQVSPEAVIGSHVVFSGDGGQVCIGSNATILPGTVINAGRNAVVICAGARVGPNAHLDGSEGSIVVGPDALIKQSAYLRENSVIDAEAIIGSSCEIKCALIGAGAVVAHFNYIGDSILGAKTHLGAGAKISNSKITSAANPAESVKIRCGDEVFDTGLVKFGAVLGDRAQLGCNAVANPGTLIGRDALIYAGSCVAGVIAARTIVKLRQTCEHDDLRL